MRILLLILLLALVMGSCKKGEDDPFFSIIPRKSRLAGEWTAISGSGSHEYIYESDAHSNSYSEIYDYYNFINTITYSDNLSQFTYERDLTVKYEFKKDFSCQEEWIEEVGSPGSSSVYTRRTLRKGRWNWAAGDGKYKSHVEMRFTSVLVEENCQGCDTTTASYSEDNAPLRTLKLHRLSKSEILMEFTDDISSEDVTDITIWNFRLLKD